MNSPINVLEKNYNLNNSNSMGNKIQQQKLVITHIEANIPKNNVSSNMFKNNFEFGNQNSINKNDHFNIQGYNDKIITMKNIQIQNNYQPPNFISTQNRDSPNNILYSMENTFSQNQNTNIMNNVNSQNQKNHQIQNSLQQNQNNMDNYYINSKLNTVPQNSFCNQIIDSNQNRYSFPCNISQNSFVNQNNIIEINKCQNSKSFSENNNNIKPQNEKINITDNSNLKFNELNEINKKLLNENVSQNFQIQGNNIITNNAITTNTILKDDEIIKSKENGFILIGKTGVGKTSLLNVIFGKAIGKVGYTSKSETKTSNFYCIKENIQGEIVYFCIVDTPGLYDCDGFDVDKEQKMQIIKLISNENIKIKGLLFLSNFQNERFDSSEQMSLLSYNVLFPLKNFWERILLVFTHYYGDPNGDTKEEIKQKSDELISDIFKIIMKKTKKISKSVEYKEIQKLYINIYSKEKNESQKKNNLEIKDSILKQIKYFIKFPPMFCKVKILYLEKFEFEKNDKYLYDCNCYYFLDINDNPVHTEYKILNKYPKNSVCQKDQRIHLNEENFTVDRNGNIIKNIVEKKKGIKEFIKNYKGEGLTCVSLLSAITSIVFPPSIFVTIPSLIGGVLLLKNKYENNEQDSNEDNNFFEYGFEWN